MAYNRVIRKKKTKRAKECRRSPSTDQPAISGHDLLVNKVHAVHASRKEGIALARKIQVLTEVS